MSKKVNKNEELLTSGIKPALQGRSRQRRDELINKGLQLMRDKNFSDMSIIDLTEACGYSVGTFYSRFQDKDSFFKAVQETCAKMMVDKLKNSFSDPSWNTAPSLAIFEQMIDVSLENATGECSGIFRESIIASTKSKEYWEPLRQSGVEGNKQLVRLLKGRFIGDGEESYQSLNFAMQMVYGTIVQAVLNNPGPVDLNTCQFRDNLVRHLTLYVKLAPT